MSAPTKYILSTQELPGGLVEAAAAGCLRLDVVPFIRTEPMAEVEIPAGGVTAVFTSQHAVEALSGAGMRPGIGVDWTIYCLDGATRRLVEKKFPGARIGGAAGKAGELADLMIRAGVRGEVVFFCGDQRLEELPKRLRESGIGVQERVVYRTIRTPVKLEREYSGIAFFSPSAVESFFSINVASEFTVLFAIGGTTADAIRKCTGREAITGSRPDKELLIREMIAHFNA